MAWTYTGPANSTRDLVRFLVGDTQSARPLLSDEELDYLLTAAGGNAYTAGAAACDAILAEHATSAVDKAMGKTSVKGSQMWDHFMELKTSLLLRAGSKPSYIDAADNTVTPQVFFTGMDDYQGYILDED